MTKADIILDVFDKVGLPKQDAEELVEMILDTIKQTLKTERYREALGVRELRGEAKTVAEGEKSQDGPGDRDHASQCRELPAEHDLQGTRH